MRYILENLKCTSEGEHEWKFVSVHNWYLGVIWAYLNAGGTNRILRRSKIR